MLCAPVKNDGRDRQRVYGSGGSIAAALIRGKTPVSFPPHFSPRIWPNRNTSSNCIQRGKVVISSGNSLRCGLLLPRLREHPLHKNPRHSCCHYEDRKSPEHFFALGAMKCDRTVASAQLSILLYSRGGTVNRQISPQSLGGS